MVSGLVMRFPFVVVWVVAVAQAQAPLTTTFASNNQGAPGGMVYFDLEVLDPAGVTVTQLDCNVASASGELEVYVTPGGHAGNEANAAVWTLAARGPITPAGIDQPSVGCLGPGFHLVPGVHGIAVRGDGMVHRYTNVATPQVFANGDLQLTAGAASNLPWGGAQYAPRIWNGAVHYQSGSGGAGTCAYVERLGEGCYAGATTFYERFDGLASVDLSGSVAMPFTLHASAAGAAGYAVVPGVPQWFVPQGVPIGDNQPVPGTLDDDDVGEPLQLPFVFAFPGGSTSVVHATANGEVYLGASAALLADVTPSGLELTTAAPRLAPLWCDLEPLANLPSNGQSGVYYDVAANGSEAYVTWLDVADGRGGPPPAGATSVSVQCVLRSDGSFTFRYAQLLAGPGTGRVVVGFGPGGGAPDPGARDLDQSLPFATDGPDRYPLAHSCTLPRIGAALSFAVERVETANVAFLMLGDVAAPAGVDLGAVGAPGCRAYTNVVGSVPVSVAQPAGTGSYALSVPADPALVGASYVSQFVAPGSGNALQAVTSNGLRWTIGS
jgi:hypothetical protein